MASSAQFCAVDSRSAFWSPMNLMTLSRLSIQCVSLASRKAHSSFPKVRWNADFTSTLWFSWSMRPSMKPSEMALTTHFSTPSSFSPSASATSESAISDLPCAMVASVSSRILDMDSWKSMPCSSKSLAFFEWKSLRSLTEPERKVVQSFTRPACLVFASALTVSKARMSSNWITEGSITASLRSSMVIALTFSLSMSAGSAPWKSWWYIFRCWKASTRLFSVRM
mmetsp:Transcript_13212/g.17886  ORF Transcript_13212/g.17886 Transcript_13212/m.17886 type:complete len:225 (-) Transcript_13212:633-1307(-)